MMLDMFEKLNIDFDARSIGVPRASGRKLRRFAYHANAQTQTPRVIHPKYLVKIIRAARRLRTSCGSQSVWNHVTQKLMPTSPLRLPSCFLPSNPPISRCLSQTRTITISSNLAVIADTSPTSFGSGAYISFREATSFQLQRLLLATSFSRVAPPPVWFASFSITPLAGQKVSTPPPVTS